MRLFLVPISTRRALIYSQPLSKNLSQKLSITDRITNKAAETWAKWEEADRGWKKHLVSWGNSVQQRIPFEEWGLKSVPSLNAQRRLSQSDADKKVDVLFPGNAIRREKLRPVLQAIAVGRQNLHRNKMWWSFIIAPLTAPIALLPVIPNIPFFYLVYRGWSHWRALNGSKHLEFLIKKDLLNPVPYPALEQLYAERVSGALKTTHAEKSAPDVVENSDDKLLLEMSDAKQLATILDAPELALEAERAIVQVEQQLNAQQGRHNADSPKKDS
ncbi:mitochondrial K+-H+ exchange-related family protein [Aspergillus chevalieri]|uniref:Mitochondrial K+-H+ exchange-related-domain-containing protein n=1 Tax=Aspergillus chevalieri TaxID=182096 RepID=A0A7R7VM28_ASPCH|nr:uncharacterized protein ACHE_30411S [Aspergillus chevalieri]BCR86424.1 hypothetical protein ACHE_30411S [Aspergillus chevalieri]